MSKLTVLLARKKVCSVSCTGTRSPGIVHWQSLRLAVWHGMALGCSRRGPAGYRPPSLQLRLATQNGVDV